MEWLNEPASWQRSGGVLSVSVDPGTDFWQETGYGYIRDSGHVYGTVVSGDLDVWVRIRGSLATQYDQAGVMLRADSRNWLKTGLELFEGRTRLSTVVTLGQSSWMVTSLPDDMTEITLRVSRRGDGVQLRYRVGDGPFELAGLAYLPPEADVLAGIMCASPEGGGFGVTFHDLRISGQDWEPATGPESAAEREAAVAGAEAEGWTGQDGQPDAEWAEPPADDGAWAAVEAPDEAGAWAGDLGAGDWHEPGQDAAAAGAADDPDAGGPWLLRWAEPAPPGAFTPGPGEPGRPGGLPEPAFAGPVADLPGRAVLFTSGPDEPGRPGDLPGPAVAVPVADVPEVAGGFAPELDEAGPSGDLPEPGAGGPAADVPEPAGAGQPGDGPEPPPAARGDAALGGHAAGNDAPAGGAHAADGAAGGEDEAGDGDEAGGDDERPPAAAGNGGGGWPDRASGAESGHWSASLTRIAASGWSALAGTPVGTGWPGPPVVARGEPDTDAADGTGDDNARPASPDTGQHAAVAAADDEQAPAGDEPEAAGAKAAGPAGRDAVAETGEAGQARAEGPGPAPAGPEPAGPELAGPEPAGPEPAAPGHDPAAHPAGGSDPGTALPFEDDYPTDPGPRTEGLADAGETAADDDEPAEAEEDPPGPLLPPRPRAAGDTRAQQGRADRGEGRGTGPWQSIRLLGTRADADADADEWISLLRADPADD